MMKFISGTSSMVRQVNRDLIREALKGMDGASAADLARTTELSVATCSHLIQELAETGEAIELAPESQGGRPARRYAYNINHSLAAVIMLLGVGEEVEFRHSVKNGAGISLANGAEACSFFSLDQLDRLLSRLLREHPAIRSVALSVPGVVRDGEIQTCDIPVLVGMNLEQHVAEKFGLRAISEKDMNFAAIGYYSQNTRDIGSSLVYVTFPSDSCIGMGVIVNGILLKGKSAFAGEVEAIPTFSRRSAGKKGGARESLIDRAATIAVSAITMLNPDIFVMTGDLATPDLHDPVRNRCLELIQEQHLPRFVIRPQCDEDVFVGMTAMALGRLTGDVKLVEKERLWCGPVR